MADDKYDGCTWRYAIVDGDRMDILDAARGQHGTCPQCNGELVARKGDVRTHHWWHVNGRCDDWYQPKGPWHLYWQNKFPVEMQEVSVQGSINGEPVWHMADIKTDSGLVVEVQYSQMSAAEARRRERFYGRMVWILGMTRDSRHNKFLNVFNKNSQKQVCGSENVWVLQCIDEKCIPSAWVSSEKFIWLDCHGTMSNPESDKDLICIVPKAEFDEFRICAYVARERFLEMCRDGSMDGLEENLLQFRDKFNAPFREEVKQNQELSRKRKEARGQWIALQEKDKQAREREQIERNARISEVMQQVESKPTKTIEYGNARFKDQLRTVNDFKWDTNETTPCIRLELPWLALWALSEKKIFSIPWQKGSVSGLCRAEMCLKSDYTIEDYQNELAHFESLFDKPALRNVPAYDHLKGYAGRRVRNGLVQPDEDGDTYLLRFNKIKK